MKIATIPGALVAVFALGHFIPAAVAQNADFEFAEALGRYEYYDLAEYVFKDISQSARYSEKDRALGRYGLARLAKIQAETERIIDNKVKLIDDAIGKIGDYLKVAKGSDLEGQAKNDIADLYTTKGRVLAKKAEIDANPAFLADAERAYEQATQQYAGAIAQFKAQEASMKGNKDWEHGFMMGMYNYAVSLFNHASLYTQNKDKADKMKGLLKEVEKICDDFMWKYDGFLVTFDLGTYRGRANAMLAEVAPTEVEREEYFKKALGGMAFQLSTDTLAGKIKEDPKLKSDPALKEIVAKGYLHKMKAFISYGDMKKKAGSHYYQMAIDDGNKAFALYSESTKEDLFLQILLEQGKAYCKLDFVDKATKILKPLTSIVNPRDPLANAAKELLLKHGGSIPLKQRLESAEAFYQQGEYDKALDEYLRLTADINTPEMQQSIPRIMYRIADCYYVMGRFFEAMVAFSIFDTPEGQQHEDFNAAMTKRLKLANRIKAITKDPADEKEWDRLQKVMVDRGIATAGVLYNQAYAHYEKKEYNKAAELFLQIDSKESEYEESAFMAAFCTYKMGRDLTAQESTVKKAEGINALLSSRKLFDNHLTLVAGLVKDKKNVDSELKKRWETSIISLVLLYTDKDPQFVDHRKALIYAGLIDRVPNPSVDRIVPIYSMKIPAHLALEEFDKAEGALKFLEEKYPHKKGNVSDGRFNLAMACDEKAKKLATSDPAKSKEFLQKANEYLVLWIKNADRTAIKPGNFRVIADRLFAYAQQTKNDEYYKLALEMYTEYDTYMKEPEKNGLKPMTKEEEENYWRILAECNLRSGNFAAAYKIYTVNLKAADNDAPLYLQIQFAELCSKRAEGEPEKSVERAEYLRKSRDIYGKLAARIDKVLSDDRATQKKPPEEIKDLSGRFWNYLYEYVSISFKVREYEKVDNLIEQYGGLYPGFDKGEFGYQAKFEELKKMNDKALELEKEKK